LNLDHLLHDFSPRVLRSTALRRVAERGTLRIGYLSARPWIYRSADGLHGHDAAAAMRLAQALKVRAWFVECRASNLATLLARGEIDLALGGLVDYGWEEVRCVPARHPVGATTGTRGGPRQVFFPNTWWLCRGDRLWCWRVSAFLWAHRLRARWSVRN
jgi:ABC-type amino acid transport substrate-binding protein